MWIFGGMINEEREWKCLERKRSKFYCKSREKGKAIPLQAWTGPECSSRLRFPDFNTIGI
jgi:hypothetical protein